MFVLRMCITSAIMIAYGMLRNLQFTSGSSALKEVPLHAVYTINMVKSFKPNNSKSYRSRPAACDLNNARQDQPEPLYLLQSLVEVIHSNTAATRI